MKQQRDNTRDWGSCRPLVVGLRNRLFTLSLLMFTSGFAGPVSGHDFEDGHVERSITLIAQEDRMIVEYGVGCSEQTMRDLIDQWSTEESVLAGQTGATDLETTSDRPSASSSETSRGGSTEAGSDSELTPDQLSDSPDTMTPETTTPETATPPTSSTPTADSDESTVEAETRLREEFAEAAMRSLSRKLSAGCNGTVSRLTPVSAEQSSRHHVDILVTLEFSLFPLPDGADEDDREFSGTVELDFQDHNFPEMTGAIRTALKVRGRNFLKQTETAPSLTRATRVEFEGLTADEILAASKVAGVLEILPPR